MNKNLICKNQIIDCIKDYNPNQIKLFYGILYEFKQNVNYKKYNKEDEMEIYLYDIKKIIEKSNISQERLSNTIYNMPNEIKKIDNKEIVKVAVFEYIIYNFEEQCLKFKVTSTFADVFLEILNNYTIIQLKYITKLNSKYSHRLYELARRYVNQNKYLMTIDYFKSYFKVPKSYKMGNIDQMILNPAINELNKKTNINCSIKKKKKGRKITHILFKFKEGNNE